MTIFIKISITLVYTFLLFLIASIISYEQQHLRFIAEAGGGGGPCIDYDSTENTIAINCDTSFLDVIQTINDPEILDQEEEQEGQYILNANLEVADGVTFAMDSNEDGL